MRISRAARGQSFLEYAVLVAVIAVAVASMVTYVRRAVQAQDKGIEEEINAAMAEEPAPK